MTDRPRLSAWRFLAWTAVVGLQALAVSIGLLLCVAFVVTLPLLPRVLRFGRGLAAGERDRVGRFLATPIPPPPATEDPTWRDLRWLVLQTTVGGLAGSVPIGSVAGVLQNVVVAAVWPLFPGSTSTLNIPVESWGGAALAVVTAAGYGLLGVLAVPPLARWYANLSADRLGPRKKTLVARLAEVTATRAAALEAHGTELRRIERSLHDGTQNRLVAVVMQLGMVERVLSRDPSAALPMVRGAQDAATDALAELRRVVRDIYPPVLADRGLSGAVASLVAHCPIPCTLDERPLPRAPAAVEAAAYFVVAEALTNAVKHSGADQITVSLRDEDGAIVVEVTDNGRGGADEAHGTGLLGIHHRVAAFDGTTSIDSPPGGPTVMRVDIPAGP
ncbi:sensor histidine kinase [Lentzea tibetensis]|uniref:histidine kinase n=1 Tax=Lentzea tibetensis TaxID=2591470 RepID=A0A563EUH2_9PSEU|nr:histidine kinase [Lentzea tibetensis]TWP50784.1 sensor histidine kinase [Lentzea tibetensis]